MKKKYQQPSTMLIGIKLANMITTSLDVSLQKAQGSTMLSRQTYDFWDEEDYEEDYEDDF